MNVLFLMIIPPDLKKNPSLYTELMEEFRDHGHHVYVAAIDEKRNGRNTRITEDSGIKVLHIRTGNLFNVNPVVKGLTTVSLGRLFKKEIRHYFGDIRFDLAMMPTPPITFAPVLDYIKQRDGAKTYLILRDIFPQNARDLHLMKSSLLFKYFRRREKYMYQVSDFIGCMSQGNIDYVLKHNSEVDPQKMELLPNWCRIEEKTRENGTDYKEKYGLQEKFICVFGGNIGWPQELEFLLELAKEVREYQDIVFLIIGKGILKPRIEKIIRDEELTNVILKDYLPMEDYDGLVSQCDVGLINLDRRFTIPNIPSKTTGYFKAGLPILASIDSNTDYGRILDEANAGLWSVTGDLESYKKNLLFFYDNPEITKQMGRNGREYLSSHWTVEKTFHIIMGHFV